MKVKSVQMSPEGRPATISERAEFLLFMMVSCGDFAHLEDDVDEVILGLRAER